MPHAYYLIMPLEDVVASESAATTGQHRSLPYIPGAMLLGAAANRAKEEGLFQGDGSQESFNIFHSGAVRFGHAMPVLRVNETYTPAFAAPLAFGVRKGDLTGNWIRIGSAINPNQQLKTVSGTLLATDAGDKHYKLRVLRNYRQGVSIESVTNKLGRAGTAREGFLFGRDAIAAGQQFLCKVTADSETLLLAACRYLEEGSLFALGRSRNVAHGHCSVQRVDGKYVIMPIVRTSTNRVSVWCLSDVCLRDPETGEPTNQPKAQHFDLPDGAQLVPEDSHYSTRDVASWNAYRRRPGTEKLAIVAGSIFTFSLPPSLEVLGGERYVGEHQQCGFGRILVGPATLHADSIEVEEQECARRAPKLEAPEPTDELFQWLSERLDTRRDRLAREKIVEAWADRLAGSKVTASQWGRLRVLAQSELAKPSPGDFVQRIRDLIMDDSKSKAARDSAFVDRAKERWIPRGSGQKKWAHQIKVSGAPAQRTIEILLGIVQSEPPTRETITRVQMLAQEMTVRAQISRVEA